MQHIIKKQVFDLQLDKRLDSFYIQQLISNQYWQSIVPGLEKAFDKAGHKDGNTELDKLVIDLGVISANQLEKEEWIKDLQTILERQLEGLNTTSVSGITVVHKTRSLGVYEQWLFYMQQGYLAWNTINADDNWYREVSDVFASDFTGARELRNLLINDPGVIRRIVWQHADSFLIKLVDALVTRQPDELLEVIKELEKISVYPQQEYGSEPVTGMMEFRNSLWIQILRKAAGWSPTSLQEAASLMQEFVQSRKLPASFLTKPAVRKLLRKEPAESKKYNDGTEKVVQPMDLPVLSESVIGEEGIYVANAGVVLLHPFLNNLFIRLKLVEQGKFVDQDAHRKALFLLHYLATGNTVAGEHELVIAKILCSYPLKEPVVAGMVLTKEELDEAGDLLTAAIQQWGILQNTTVDGLREGFLQRKGKVFTRQASIYLQVETSSIDILLDHLPWSLSMIKLPWMEDIMRVEWR
ncbi:MAG TPA: contractile injection system tape measure protein [Bacteroidales bacterium]|nr:contractile injection system tape measure protein [Bacteroidales bacterium]